VAIVFHNLNDPCRANRLQDVHRSGPAAVPDWPHEDIDRLEIGGASRRPRARVGAGLLDLAPLLVEDDQTRSGVEVV
jgi:hypothetical protein